VSFLDLPVLHGYRDEIADKFFEELAECENLEIF
jgi:hypothetical protein